MLGVVLVHPEHREVIPLAPEPIVKGDGYKNLCSVMTMLMMLAFLIDQVQQLTCKVYQKARKHVGRLPTLFERVRTLISIGVFNSWQQLYTFIGDPVDSIRYKGTDSIIFKKRLKPPK